MKSTTGFLLLLTFLGFSCSVYKKQNFKVIFPFPSDSSYIKIDGLYKNFGKILYTKDNHTTIEKHYISDGYKIFKPNIIEILSAERLMFEKKSNYYNNDTIGVIKGFFSFYRQYIGIIKANRDSIIVINLINPKSFNKENIEDNFYIILDNNNVAIKLPLKVKNIKKQNTTTSSYVIISKSAVNEDQ